MSPARIQRQQTKGWRIPAGAVYVGPGSPWANPFTPSRRHRTQVRMPGLRGQDWEHEGRLYKTSGQRHAFVHSGGRVTWHLVEDATAEQCVELYRERMTGATTRLDYRHEDQSAQVVEALGGRDLVCWCPLGQPCHADVLLELANGPAARV